MFLEGFAHGAIGGSAAGAGNTIAFYGRDGVYVPFAISTSISRNSIHSNAGLGIDLRADGVDTNDLGDPDDGGNFGQNYPVLTSALVFGSNTTIKGSLNSADSTAFALEFFSNAACDVSGNGEGETFEVSSTQTTDGVGDVTFTVFVGSAVPVGRFVNTFDVAPFITPLNSVAPGPPYTARLDLNMSGNINAFDVVPFIQLLNKACLP